MTRNPEQTHRKLIEAAVRLMLRQGFAATTIGDICAEAGVTKGSFFHHFKDKEALALAAVDWWGDYGAGLYARAGEGRDPLENLRRLFEIMIGMTTQADGPCVCMVGMLAQELSGTNPRMRGECAGQLERWSDHVAGLLSAAKTVRPTARNFDPGDLAWFLNSLWQGSMLVGKTCGTPEMIRRNLELARDHVESLLSETVESPA